MQRLLFTLLALLIFQSPLFLRDVDASSIRFTDQNDGTVLDNQTGLVWLKNANCFGTNTWTTAIDSANGLANGACGLSDGSIPGQWHLPTLEQINALVDISQTNPALPPGAPFSAVQPGYYWSSTTHSDVTDDAWVVQMYNGYVYYDGKYYSNYVWPVRSKLWELGSLEIKGSPYFQTVRLGAPLAAKEIILRNLGGTPLTITSAAINGANAVDFKLAPGGKSPCVSLSPILPGGDFCTLNLEFTPINKGTKAASLTLAANGQAIDIPVTGTAYTTISGKVVDMTTKAAISGAIVTISGGATAFSDAAGNFIFTTPPANGNYTATISSSGYANTVAYGLIISDTKGAELNIGLVAPGTLNIASPTTLLTGETGKNFDLRIPVSGGTAPFTLGKVYGSLPPGLTLDSTGISGIPTTIGSYTFAISVSDSSSGYSELEYTMAVTAPLAITADAILPRASKSGFYTRNIDVSGGTAPYIFILLFGQLPAGLTLDSSTGAVSGNVNLQAAGTGFTIKVTDSAGRTTSRNFSLPVDELLAIRTARLSDTVVGAASSQQLTATGGYAPYTWALFSGVLPQGLALNSTSGVLSGTPAETISHLIVLSVQDAAGRIVYKQFTINALNLLKFESTAMPNAHVGSAYSEQVRISGGIAPYRFSYTGLVPNGLTLDATTGVISGTPVTAGFVNLKITVIDSTYPIAQSVMQEIGFRTTSQLTITNSSILPTGRQSVAINPVTLTAAGGSSPYTWSVVDGALPAGLTLDSGSGTISGTPTAKGDYIFRLRVTDSTGSATGSSAINPDKQFFMHISAPLAVITNLLPNAAVGIPLVAELQAAGGQKHYRWAVVTGTLPSGLTLDSNGIISGIPAARISSAVTFSVTDSDNPAQTAQKLLVFNVVDDLAIQETTLPQARQQQAYTTTIHALLGVAPYSWKVASGNLPPGMTLTQNAGMAMIQGTPTTAGIYTFTIEVSHSGNPQKVAATEFTITVLPVFTITATDLKVAVRVIPYNETITASGGAGPYSFAVISGSLPIGLTMDPFSGIISGVTTAPAGKSSSFTVRVTDSGNPQTYLDKAFSIFVVGELETPDPIFIDNSTNILHGETGKAFDFRIIVTGGITPLSLNTVSGSLPPGIVLDSTGISGIPTAVGPYTFTIRASDITGGYDEQEYTMLVNMLTPMNIVNTTPLLYGETGSGFDLRIVIKGGSEPFTLNKAYGSMPPGIALDATGISGTPTAAGSYTFAIRATDSADRLAEKEFTLVVTAPLTIVPEALTRSTKGANYTDRVIVTGGSAPYIFTLLTGQLPAGLSLDKSTGSISGTVDTNATGTGFTLNVTDSANRTVSRYFSLAVDEPFLISSTRLSDAIAGTASSQQLAATGGYPPYTWSVFSGVLPQGLALDSASGILSGTALDATSQQIVLSVQDAAGRVIYKQFTMNVFNPLQIETTTMPNAHVGSLYSELIRTSGGIAPYRFSYIGSLPDGLTLDNNSGVISGIPTSAGYVNLTLTVIDSTYPIAQSITQELGVRTTSQLTITNSSILPTVRQDMAMNPVTLTAAGGSSPYTWSVVDALPAGLTLDAASGTISGVPTAKGDFIFTIRITDSAGNATGRDVANPDKQFFIHVSSLLTVTSILLPQGGVGIPYIATLEADGGQQLLNWDIVTGTLPNGMILNANGEISGTPTAKITSTVTFRVTDSDNPAQTAQKVLKFNVVDNLTIQETTLPQAREQQAYTTTIHALLGVTPYSWKVASGDLLPPGMTLTQNAGMVTLQGTPTAAGMYTFKIEVSDSSDPQQVASTEFSITVLPVFAITTGTLKEAVRTIPYSETITASGGAAPYRFARISDNPPDGLILDPVSGVISGVTTTPAGQSSSFTVRVTDSGNPKTYLDKLFSIFVLDEHTVVTSTQPATVQQSSAGCNTSGAVSISEVQSAINMFLGVKTADPCVDTGGDKSVSIDEVQRVINVFLGNSN